MDPPSGTAVRYLGCHVGLDLTAEQQIVSLLLSIRRKLLFWSSASLSCRTGGSGQSSVVGYYVVQYFMMDILRLMHQPGSTVD